MDDYLTKPVNEKHLDHMLGKWTRDRRDNLADDALAREDNPASDDAVLLPGQSPAFDKALALKRCANKLALATDMHRMLLEQLDGDMEAIEAYAADGQRDELLEQVHRLHGATRYCGTPRLEQAAREMEVALKQGARDEIIATSLRNLVEEAQRLRSDQALSRMMNATT